MAEPIVVGNLVLDGEVVRDPDGSYHIDSQQGWEKLFAYSGKSIPTVEEIVITFKYLNERKDRALRGILYDLKESALCSGKINYSKSNIPVGEGYIETLIKDSAWQKALEDEMFHCDAKEAVNVIEEISKKRLYLWAPSVKERISQPERAVWLLIDTCRFYLSCYDILTNNVGRARGVLVNGANRGVPLSTPEPKFISAPTVRIDNPNHQLENIYPRDQVAYALHLLNGGSSGTVMDWKKR